MLSDGENKICLVALFINNKTKLNETREKER